MNIKKLISLLLILQSAYVPVAKPYAAHIEAIHRAMEQCASDNGKQEELTDEAFVMVLKKEFNELVTSLQSTRPAIAQQLQQIDVYIQNLTVPVSIPSIYLIADQCSQSPLNFGDLPADEQDKLRTLIISMNTFFMRVLGLDTSEIVHLLAATTQLESDLNLFADMTALQTTHVTELEQLLQQPLSAAPTMDIPDFDAAQLFEKFDKEDDALDEEEDNKTKQALLKAFLASSGVAGAFFLRNVYRHMKANPKAKVIDPATIWAGIKSISQPLKIVGGIIIGAAILYKLSKWIHEDCKKRRKALKKTYKDELNDHKEKVKKEMNEFKDKINTDFKKREADANAFQDKLKKQAEEANKKYTDNIQASGTALKEATKEVKDLNTTTLTNVEALKKQVLGDVELFKRQVAAIIESNKANTKDLCTILEQIQTLLGKVNLDTETKKELAELQKSVGKKVVRLQENLASSPDTPRKQGLLSRTFGLRRKSSKTSPGGAGSGSDYSGTEPDEFLDDKAEK